MVLPSGVQPSFLSRVGGGAASVLPGLSALESAPSVVVPTSDLFELLKANYADRLASVARAAGAGAPLENERVGAAGAEGSFRRG